MPRLYCPTPLAPDQLLALPPGPARHVQVLRMQPGEEVTLFNGHGGEWGAVIERMGRSDVDVRITKHDDVEREAEVAVHLAMGIPANERMDWLVEKATELGVASIQPLVTSRAVLRVAGERARKKQEHWQAISAAACEQGGRNRVPLVHEPAGLADWLARLERPAGDARFVLSLEAGAPRLSPQLPGAAKSCVLLSGPEGGLEPREEADAQDAGFTRVSLGPRILRAETAPLAALSLLTLS
jgi:16S rRNA (uracil1498-N3)-methyltransferase